MIARALTTLILFLLPVNGAVFSQQEYGHQNEVAKVGNPIRIQLTGDLATEFQKCIGALDSYQQPPGLKITANATIIKQLSDGRIRVEYTGHIDRDGEPARLVTLTADVAFKLTTHVIPKGSMMGATQAENEKSYGAFTPTTAERKERVLVLSDRKGIKLRTWRLDKEFGD